MLALANPYDPNALMVVKLCGNVLPQYALLVYEFHCILSCDQDIATLKKEVASERLKTGPEQARRKSKVSQDDTCRADSITLNEAKEKEATSGTSVRSTHGSASGIALSAFPLSHSFRLLPDMMIYTLSLETPLAIDHVLLQSDCRLDLVDMETNSAIVSYSELESEQVGQAKQVYIVCCEDLHFIGKCNMRGW
ncbi:unnamed protein product [Protopolystoma xenopodis]|uniref:BBS7 GAE domain-containing protein n=1 Tax=Protopolystoma xenopodis TaxID=117903 RepID=A0A448XFA0_9PLAT|nr:unnamed protein product [Protopolystoma xenopodis]